MPIPNEAGKALHGLRDALLALRRMVLAEAETFASAIGRGLSRDPGMRP